MAYSLTTQSSYPEYMYISLQFINHCIYCRKLPLNQLQQRTIAVLFVWISSVFQPLVSPAVTHSVIHVFADWPEESLDLPPVLSVEKSQCPVSQTTVSSFYFKLSFVIAKFLKFTTNQRRRVQCRDQYYKIRTKVQKFYCNRYLYIYFQKKGTSLSNTAQAKEWERALLPLRYDMSVTQSYDIKMRVHLTYNK